MGDLAEERWSEKAVRLAQTIQVGPCIPVGIQRWKAEVGPTPGPTWGLAHFGAALPLIGDLRAARPGARARRRAGGAVLPSPGRHDHSALPFHTVIGCH